MERPLQDPDAGNPYAPPVAGETDWDPQVAEEAQAPVRSSAPRIFGILSIIFASLTAVGSLTGGCLGYLGKNMPQMHTVMSQGTQEPEKTAKAYHEFYRSTFGASVTSSVVYFVMSLALLVVGFGQLRFRRWARSLTLAWGWAALVALAVVVTVTMLVVEPASTRMMESLKETAPTGSLDAHFYSTMGSFTGGWFSVIMTVVSYAPYPILLLYIFSKPRIKAAMDR